MVPPMTSNQTGPTTERTKLAPNSTAGDTLGMNGTKPSPLLVDVTGLAVLLARSQASLHRDDSAGRLPAAVRIGGSKRWRVADVEQWVAWGCPSRREFEARKNAVKR